MMEKTQGQILGVIFDLDGTLVRSNLEFDAIRDEIGIDNGPILEAMADMDASGRARAKAILARHEAEAAENAPLMPGAKDLLDGLTGQGLKIALMTRNSRQSVETCTRRHDLRFDFIRTRDDGIAKPSPEPVLAVCRALALTPTDCIHVGDHRFDVEAGNAAGCTTVLLRNPNANLNHVQPDYTIDTLSQIKSLTSPLHNNR